MGQAGSPRPDPTRALGQEVFKFSLVELDRFWRSKFPGRVGSGRVKWFLNITERIGSDHPDPARSVEQPWL